MLNQNTIHTKKALEKDVYSPLLINSFIILTWLTFFRQIALTYLGGTIIVLLHFAFCLIFMFKAHSNKNSINTDRLYIIFGIFSFIYFLYFGFIATEFSTYYNYLGFNIPKQIWNYILLIPFIISFILIIKHTNQSNKNIYGKTILSLITISALLNTIVLIIDPSLKKMGPEENIFLTGYSWAYVIPIILPVILFKIKDFFGIKKALFIFGIIILLASQFYSSFFIAIVATILAILLFLIFRIKKSWLRWGLVIFLITFTFYIINSQTLAVFFEGIARTLGEGFIKSRLYEMAEFVRNPDYVSEGLTTYRFALYKESFTNFLKHPILGNLWFDPIAYHSFQDHSTILDLMACGGLLLSVPFFLFIYKIYKFVLGYCNKNEQAKKSLIASIIVFIFIALFNPIMGSFYSIGALLFIIPLILAINNPKNS